MSLLRNLSCIIMMDWPTRRTWCDRLL